MNATALSLSLYSLFSLYISSYWVIIVFAWALTFNGGTFSAVAALFQQGQGRSGVRNVYADAGSGAWGVRGVQPFVNVDALNARRPRGHGGKEDEGRGHGAVNANEGRRYGGTLTRDGGTWPR